MKKKIVGLIAAVVIVAAISAMAMPVSAGTIYDTIQKGQTKSWMIDPGNTQNPSLEVLYYPNNQGTVRFEWRQEWLVYLINGGPQVITKVYWSETGQGNWRYIYHSNCDLWWQGTTGYLQKGVYKIQMICYGDGAGVTLRVR